RRKRVAQLVSEHREELILSVIFLRKANFLELPFRDVAQDLCESAQCSPLVPERRKYAGCPKLRAVLSNVPALILRSAFLLRQIELAFRLIVLNIQRREKQRERPAEHFVLVISEYSLRSRAPIADCSCNADEKNCIVPHVLNEKAILLLGRR